MKFKLPEDLASKTPAELTALKDEATIEAREIAVLPDADITAELLTDLETLAEAIDAIDARVTELAEADQAKTDRLAAARGKVPAATNAEEDEQPAEKTEDEVVAETVIPDDASELEEEKEAVTASAAGKGVIARTAKSSKEPVVVEDEKPAVAALVAAGNLTKVAAGHEFADLTEVAEQFGLQARRSPGKNSIKMKDGQKFGLSNAAVRSGLIKIEKPTNEFEAGTDMSISEQLAAIDAAADEHGRFGAGGIIAAGGWCAPSEILYDGFCKFETVSGILSIPEVTIRRGGVQFTPGPSYAAIYADPDFGFIQTEAQAEAGTEKVCYAVECPDFTDHRLDAIGFCITAGVLTNSAAGYPELIRRVLEIGLVAHAHTVNAEVISRISALIGTAINWAEIGATTSDILDAVALQAQRIRYSLSMAPNATIEAVFPVWAIEIFRSDLSRRTGIDLLAVTDADVKRYLGARGVAAQWVYDYQNITDTNTGTWTSFPDTLEFMMYPAGTFFKGTSPVIDLDTIYDSVGLSTNTYTAAFFEEGLLVAQRCGMGVKVQVNVASLLGQTGAANLGLVVTP